MVGLTGYKDWMDGILPLNIWYVISALLAPVRFILQEVVAGAMTVEAVPAFQADGTPLAEHELKRMHVTEQTLGRVAILSGSAGIAGRGGWLAQTIFICGDYSLLPKQSRSLANLRCADSPAT
jgi:hypothetical protein